MLERLIRKGYISINLIPTTPTKMKKTSEVTFLLMYSTLFLLLHIFTPAEQWNKT